MPSTFEQHWATASDCMAAASAAARNRRTAWKRKVPEPQAGSSTRWQRRSLARSHIRAASQSGV